MAIGMIIDTLKQLKSYQRMIPGWEKVLAFLESCSELTPNGRYEIEGDNIYANVFDYDTADPGELSWESHRIYIDLHVLLGGEERILWAPAGELTRTSEYNAEKDCEFYSGNHRQSIDAARDQFALFFPDDGHKVKCHLKGPSHVKKTVVKIRMI